jgi:tight adherence protein C
MGDTVIVFVSALLAAASFVAIALPFLNRQDKKDRYQAVIEKKRKALFATTKENIANPSSVSAKDSIASFYKLQKMFGAYGEKLRDSMLQAGIRDPKAPIYFLIARIALPTFLMMFTALIMLKGQKDFTGGQVMVGLLFMGAAGFFIPKLLIKNHIQKRQQEISLAFPDALDMMLVCVQGGIGLEQTISRIADEIADHSDVLAEELGILSAEMGLLSDRRLALQDFARRVGSGAARSFATAMIQAEQYGTSVSQAMGVIADELRMERMSAAEQKAASLPPKLTVPMILFFLPVLFVVILAPAVMQVKSAGF